MEARPTLPELSSNWLNENCVCVCVHVWARWLYSQAEFQVLKGFNWKLLTTIHVKYKKGNNKEI